MTQESRPRVTLPVPRSVRIQDFTLYQNVADVRVDFHDGVLCLVGANGLGKSTFLNILTYAITGLVPEPDRKFESLSEYHRHTTSYARRYFRGRISDDDAESATVTLYMTVGSTEYELERSFFEPEALRRLSIRTDGYLVHDQDDALSDEERNGIYRGQVVKDTGLANFEQLVFLQHFVLTFDERRRLLLWDDRTTEQALMLAFGVPPDLARKADDWRRRIERAESQARNLQYQATTAKNRMAEIEGAVANLEVSELPEYSTIRREREGLLTSRSRLVNERESASVLEAEAQARLVTLEQQYDDAILKGLQPPPSSHPLLLEALETDACPICGTQHVASRLRDLLTASTCPLCLSAIEEEASTDELLQTLDRDLNAARVHAHTVQRRVRELDRELEGIQGELAELDRRLSDSPGAATPPQTLNPEAFSTLLQQFQREADSATERRDEYRRRRDEFRSLLKPVTRELAQRYASGESDFVPNFAELAGRFLGLDISVRLSESAGQQRLIVTIDGSERRAYDQLSESQRYFLDIAFRMALVMYMSAGTPSCLFIDTPEGSLDISYEARAGDMFSQFVSGPHRMIMTANINTSRLLQELAANCGPEKMTVVRMMAWSKLSDVQAAGEDLFDEAFHQLTTALTQGRSSA